jgi:hypothetical protein
MNNTSFFKFRFSFQRFAYYKKNFNTSQAKKPFILSRFKYILIHLL